MLQSAVAVCFFLKKNIQLMSLQLGKKTAVADCRLKDQIQLLSHALAQNSAVAVGCFKDKIELKATAHFY